MGSKTVTGMSLQQAVYSNLVLLGMQQNEYEAKYRQSFGPNMFAVSASASRNAIEVVIKFIFDALDPHKSAAVFKLCWPVVHQKQEVAFRKAAGKWIGELRDTTASAAGLPRHAPAILLNPSGLKVYHLVLKLTNIVLENRISRLSAEHGVVARNILSYDAVTKTSNVMPDDDASISSSGKHADDHAKPTTAECRLRMKAMELHMARLSQRFVSHSCHAVSQQRVWRSYAIQLTRMWRQGDKTLQDVKVRCYWSQLHVYAVNPKICVC